MADSENKHAGHHSVDPDNEKRMQDHIRNEKDEITEEDIQNVKTSFDADVQEEELTRDEKAVRSKKLEDDSDTSVDTSWNVLGE